MTTKTINYNLGEMSLAMFRLDDDAAELVQIVYDDSVQMLTADYKRLFDMLVSGKIDYFRHGTKTIYLFTRSTRPGVLVQRSVFWDRSGDLVPVSHADICSFADMSSGYNDFCIDNVTVNYGTAADFAA